MFLGRSAMVAAGITFPDKAMGLSFWTRAGSGEAIDRVLMRWDYCDVVG